MVGGEIGGWPGGGGMVPLLSRVVALVAPSWLKAHASHFLRPSIRRPTNGCLYAAQDIFLLTAPHQIRYPRSHMTLAFAAGTSPALARGLAGPSSIIEAFVGCLGCLWSLPQGNCSSPQGRGRTSGGHSNGKGWFVMRKFQILLFALFYMAIAFSAHALEIRELLVKFNEGYFTKRPINIGSQMAAWQVDKYISIPSIPNVMSFKPIGYPVNHPIGFSGPFVVEVLVEGDPVDYLAQVLSDPNIEYAIWGDESAIPLSEDPAKLFPPQSQDLFCNERQLHRRVEGEPLGNGEWCSEVEAGEDHDMDLPQAWGISKGDTSIVVAIIDSGVDWRHPDFGGSPPPFQVAPEESIFFYRDGNIFTNWNEGFGDANHDDRPGIAGVDDDGDGLRDEDSQGFEEWNDAESDVFLGTVSSVSGNYITDNSQIFPPNIQGFRFYSRPYGGEYTFGEILSVNGNSIEVAVPDGIPVSITWEMILTAWGGPPWPYKIGDGDDNNELYPDGFIDDVGWLNDLVNDDDENGFPDDIHGWDFISKISASHTPITAEDYLVPDNNPYSLAQHGTTMASLLGATDLKGRVVGVSPKVKILPLRIGYAKWDTTGSIGVGGLDDTERVMAYDYAKKMGVDIVSLSMDKKNQQGNQCPTWTSGDIATQDLIDYGAIVIVAAGNDGFVDPDTPNILGCPSPSLVVAGVDIFDIYDTPDPSYISDYGDWVDLSACFGPVWAATPLGMGIPDEPDYTNWVVGTSGCAPMVAGVAVLVRSIYPNFSVEEVVNKIQVSTDDIYQYPENWNYIGKLGSGRVNAYKALTFYGQIPSSVPDTTWAHNIWIGGDIAVPSGTILTISGGDTVRVAADDLLSSGNDPDEIEFRIDGVLHVQGSPESPVVFELFDGSQMAWEYDSVVSISGETFNVGGLGIATIASTAHSPLVPNTGAVSQVFSVEIAGVSAGETVEVDLAGLGLAGTTLPLFDDGQGADLLASDGIFSSAAFSASLAGGSSYTVDVSVHASDGGYTRKSVSIEVPDLMAKLQDVSGSTGLTYLGDPYSSISCDFDSQKEGDLVVAVNSGPPSVIQVFDQVLPSGSPTFLQPYALVGSGARGLMSGDYDNDGDEDLFVAHSSSPKLYRNNSGVYEDVTSSLGLSSLAAGSTLGCWADYDNDGWVDLFVARSDLAPGGSEPPDIHNINYTQHRLFHNEVGLGGGFVDVTTASGISINTNGSVAASWGDLEGDGDLDLIVLNLCDPPLGQTLLFVNQGSGAFTEEGVTRLERSVYSGEPILFGTGVAWADMDNDGDFDLVFSCAENGSSVWLNNGSGVFPLGKRMILPVLGGGFSGLSVFDHDLDGWQDILLITKDAGIPSRLLLGRPTADGIAFVDNTYNAGLALSSAAMGSVASDFTGDGDCDLFMGRPIASGEYFYITKDQVDQDSLGQRYVKVRLESPANDMVNRQGIGAVVEVTAGSLIQTQIVDGGSGRGGQKDRTLTFGLGDYSSDIVTATVRWPGGLVQPGVALIVSGGTAPETVNVISDVAPVLSDVKSEMVIDPGTGDVDWKFSWNTIAATTNADDTVFIDQSGILDPCLPGWTMIVPGSLPYSYTYDSSSGYEHVLIIPNWDCEGPCSFRFSVESDNGMDSTQSSQVTKRVRVCPTQF